ncbi:MAG: hypothetical protein JXA49_09930 [Actinobacteria bacterium]|nr:hypothetical protein [Actinomycetota bacterium]
MKIVQVGASTKKGGKTALAEYLVSELKADFALKISSGGHHSGDRAVTVNPRIISKPDTDTGRLVKAGARKVIWVSAAENELERHVNEAMELFGSDGLLIVEGNSGSRFIDADFTVFLMNVPMRLFKESAYATISESGLVLVNLSGELSEVEMSKLSAEIKSIAPKAEILEFSPGEPIGAFSMAAEIIRKNLSLVENAIQVEKEPS